MKAVILCGGRGTRLGEHGEHVPKALITIGGKPIIWHILKLYSEHGINEFVLCLGFLGDKIREYFATADDDWKIVFAETGADTNTGGRLKRVAGFLAGEADFCVTYGDGLADVDLRELIEFHRTHGKIATLTAVHPISAFGVIKLGEADEIIEFAEKPRLKEWVNGGFFVFNQSILKHLGNDSVLEREPFESLAAARQLIAFRHSRFWKCMDTFKDNLEFNQLWDAGRAAWKIW